MINKSLVFLLFVTIVVAYLCVYFHSLVPLIAFLLTPLVLMLVSAFLVAFVRKRDIYIAVMSPQINANHYNQHVDDEVSVDRLN